MSEPLIVMFLSPEVAPFAKTGGLADVAGALPRALKTEGLDVRLCLPYYRVVSERYFEPQPLLEKLKVPLGNELLEARVLETRMGNEIPLYLIQREDLYDRPNLYGDASGDYYDNLERFTFFAHAALRICPALSFKPDLFHCHDWQTGLVPALLKGPYRSDTTLQHIPCVFTIHNVGYQGIFPLEKFSVTGLSGEGYLSPSGMEFWGKMSLLKAGLVYAEAITTVSPTYAREIQTAEFGMGMEGILRHRRPVLHGILNGVDYDLWDPSGDPYLCANYTLGNMAGKKSCKEDLIEAFGLKTFQKTRPLLAVISRLDRQKGVDLLLEILDDILSLGIGLVVLGAGEQRIRQQLRHAASRHAGRVGFRFGFDEPLAHRIMAGSDIFLLPSRYEPCGLTQVYALRYGTVPVARSTGGLEDTITQYDPTTGEGTGFKFAPYESSAFLSSIRQAVALFEQPEQWRQLVVSGMKADFSWSRSAEAYTALYGGIIGRGHGTGA